MVKTFAPDLADIDYHPDGTGNVYQRADLYKVTPGLELPADHLFPLLIVFGGGDFLTTTKPAELTPAEGLPYLARLRGFQVLWATYTITDDALPGDGIFGEPEDAETCSAHCVQWARFNAIAHRIDTSRIFFYGIESGATAAAWASLGPELATGTGQRAQSSRPAGAILEGVDANWPTLKDSLPATHFSVTPTDTLGDIPDLDKEAASVLNYGVTGLNASQPVYLEHEVAGISTNYVGPPYVQNSEDQYSAWSGFAIQRLLGLLDASFHLQNSKRVDRSPGFPTPGDVELDQLDWLLGRAGMLSAEETIIREVESRLREITIANGFHTEVERVFRFGKPAIEVEAFPSIMVTALRARFDDSQNATRDTVELELGLTLTLSGWQDYETRVSTFIADVRKRIKRDIQFDEQIDMAEIREGDRFLDRDEEQGDRSGAVLVLRLQYLEQVDDPYTLAPDPC